MKTLSSITLYLFYLLAACQQPERSILVIGDSNSAIDGNWITILRELDPGLTITNYSTPGNTIGFDNLDNPKLNTIKNINSYLDRFFEKERQADFIILMLGTNDAKKVFAERQEEVYQNMDTLVSRIGRYLKREELDRTKIIVVSPPPYYDSGQIAEKYSGAPERVARMRDEFRVLCAAKGISFIDSYTPLKKDIHVLTRDGVHLNAKGQRRLAKIIEQGISALK